MKTRRKKIVLIILLIYTVGLCIRVLTGCDPVIRGEEGLIAKAREELPFSEAVADTVKLSIAGYSSNESNRLYWFVSGNKYQAHTYMAIDFSMAADGGLVFVKSYKNPIERYMDTAALMWNDAYSFVINNDEVCYLRLIYDSLRIEEITIDRLPFVYCTGTIYTELEYYYLDAEKNALMP